MKRVQSKIDAVSLFGMGECPPSRFKWDGASVELRYGGWSFQELLRNDVVRKHNLLPTEDEVPFSDQPWFTAHLVAGEKELLIPGNFGGREAKFEKVLEHSARLAQMVLVASAAAAYRLSTGKSLIPNGGTIWCEETLRAECYSVMCLSSRGDCTFEWRNRLDWGEGNDFIATYVL